MTSAERREQLIAVACGVFAHKGFDGTSVEEIATCANVSKPVVYEHFGGKEGLYAVVVDREVRALTQRIHSALEIDADERGVIEAGTLALLDYIESNPDGFRILSRDSSVGSSSGSFASILSDVAATVGNLLTDELRKRNLDHKAAPLYAQALVGMIALTGQWWLDVRKPAKREVAAHLVNLAWNGLTALEKDPKLQK